MKSMFQQHRNLPKKLKFICYGSKDILFEEDLLSEKAGFYCYENRLGEENEKELQNRYEDIFGERVKNIQ